LTSRPSLGDAVAATAPLAGQVAVVTGAAQGIGRATAMGLALAGADVAMLDRQADLAEDACEQLRSLGRHAVAVPIDLAELDAIPAAVTSVLDALGRIDILVNAAGVEGGRAGLLDLDLATWERTHRIDLTAPFLLMQHCARAMAAGGRGGRIVSVTSSSAFRASLAQPDYASAKSAIGGLTRVAAAQLAEHDINVNCVAPGLTVTPAIESKMSAEHVDQLVQQGPLENLFHRASTPDDVASAIVFLCLPASRQVTGQTIHTSAGAVV
jgi:NAD(P)-dependent dehydrogenase (short-subunit alcohol dehydrogenase family)